MPHTEESYQKYKITAIETWLQRHGKGFGSEWVCKCGETGIADVDSKLTHLRKCNPLLFKSIDAKE